MIDSRFRGACSGLPLLLWAIAAFSACDGGLIRPIAGTPVVDRDVPGDAVIDVSAGNATGEMGWSSSTPDIYMDIDAGDDNVIEILTHGRVDASFVPAFPRHVRLGVNPIVVTEDLVIPSVLSEPAAGTAYIVHLDAGLSPDEVPGVIRFSDGDGELRDEPAVTGIHVHPGSTLTLEGIDAAATGWAALSAGLLVEGQILPEDVDGKLRGSLRFDVGGDSLISGSIDVSGTGPGQSGGLLYLWTRGDIFVSGRLEASGAAAEDADAGDSGAIWIRGVEGIDDSALFECTGELLTRGGDATGATGAGGHAIGVTVDARGPIRISGSVDVSAGSGVSRSGEAGGVILSARRGSLQSAASLVSNGGDAIDGLVGGGGWFHLIAMGGSVTSSGDITARGMHSSGPDGVSSLNRGEGGTLQIMTDESESDAPEVSSAGNIWVSGNIDLRGGDGPDQARNGGMLFARVANREVLSPPRSITFVGYAGIASDGGDGAQRGGRAGDIVLMSTGESGVGGRVVVEPPISARGGTAYPELEGSSGGRGGELIYRADSLAVGPLDLHGGAGDSHGRDGVIKQF